MCNTGDWLESPGQAAGLVSNLCDAEETLLGPDSQGVTCGPRVQPMSNLSERVKEVFLPLFRSYSSRISRMNLIFRYRMA